MEPKVEAGVSIKGKRKAGKGKAGDGKGKAGDGKAAAWDFSDTVDLVLRVMGPNRDPPQQVRSPISKNVSDRWFCP